MKSVLADAQTGQLRSALSEKEAIECAKGQIKRYSYNKKVEYLTEAGPHHEYRKSLCPHMQLHSLGNAPVHGY